MKNKKHVFIIGYSTKFYDDTLYDSFLTAAGMGGEIMSRKLAFH